LIPVYVLRQYMELVIEWSTYSMLNTVRNKLILLFTCSTGSILTVFLFLVYMYTNQLIKLNQQNAFQNNYQAVYQSVQMTNKISDLWLSEMELGNNLIIHIEDNGIPLLYQGSWQAPTNRDILIDRVRELALQDNINLKVKPITKKEIRSKIYTLKGEKKDNYLGEAVIFPTSGGYRTIILLQYISGDRKGMEQIWFILLLDLVGILVLFLLSRWLMRISLRPVEESRRRQTEFVAAASHELKSPLSVIRANSSAIMLEPRNMEHYTKGIDKECARLGQLIEDMLILANADAKTWRIKSEIIDIETVLIDSYDTFAPLFQEHNKKLKLELQEKLLPRIQGDALRLKQIMAILLDNAISYSVIGDTIILRAYVKKNQLWIEVEDHGVGIEHCKKSEVFERFYREDKSRKDKNHYGLGLSIAKELVELHSGTISVRDTIGGGATFFIRLPVYKANSSKDIEGTV
jgi:OmpR-family two-component system manganese-sensing sensor histidine kinase